MIDGKNEIPAGAGGVFRTEVRMAAVQVAGLSPEELRSALAYEVEPFSGIPAAEAEIEYVSVEDSDPSVRVFEVTVRRRSRRHAFADGAGGMLKAAAVFAAVVFAALASDWFYLSRKDAALARETAYRQRLDDELKALRGKTASLKAQAEKIRADRAAAVKAQEDCAASREIFPRCFGAIASAFGDKAVLKSFGPGGKAYSMELKAVAVSAVAASETMAALGEAASRRGLSFAPGAITADSGTSTAGFTCTLWK